MWFFMYACYVMSFLTVGLLLTAFIQSFTNFHILEANHLTFMVLTSIVYSFTETLIIFFFVGTGVSVRDYTKEHGLSNEYHKRSIQIKRKVYPPLLLNMLFMIILFCLVGAVDTNRVPKWVYYSLFVFCIGQYMWVKIKQNECFKENTQIILDMSGVRRS